MTGSGKENHLHQEQDESKLMMTPQTIKRGHGQNIDMNDEPTRISYGNINAVVAMSPSPLIKAPAELQDNDDQNRRGSQSMMLMDHDEICISEEQSDSNQLRNLDAQTLEPSVSESPAVNSRIQSDAPIQVNNQNKFILPKQKFREEAIPLITFDEQEDKFSVNPLAKQIISNIQAPLGIVTVAGMYRTGKSYLLNRMLLNRQKGFGVGPSINPCTKGIWIWGTPISGFTSSGQPINVLVVDSEGIGGLDEENNHDMRIFTLALLISSYFLYNSMGSIDENALQSLSLVINLSKHISAKTSENGEQMNQNLSEFLPSFMWVVRDFTLQLVDHESNEITPKEYLEQALEDRGDPQDPKNQIRQHLRKYFNDRDCCTIIRPLVDETKLQEVENLEIEDLRADFIEQVMLLRRKVLSRIEPKSINNAELDGRSWIDLISLYVQAINNGTVPDIQSSWVNICRSQGQQAFEVSFKLFEDELEKNLQMPMNEQDLNHLLGEIKTKAQREFKQETRGDNEIINDYHYKFENELNDKIIDLKNSNQQECHRYAEAVLQQLFSELDQQFQANQETYIANLQQIDFALRELTNFYDVNVFDYSEKRLLLAESKVQFVCEQLMIATSRFQNEMNLQKELEDQINGKLSQVVKEAKDESREERMKLEDKLKTVQLQKTELEASHQLLQEQYENLKESKKNDEQDSQKLIQQLREQLNHKEDDYLNQTDAFEEKLKQMQRSLKQTESEFDKQKALFEQKIDYLEKTVAEKTERERSHMNEWKTQKTEMSSEIKQVCAKYETEIKTLQAQLEEHTDKAQELENLLAQKQAQSIELERQQLEQIEQLKLSLRESQKSGKDLESQVKTLKQENEIQLAEKLKNMEQESEQNAAKQTELQNKLRLAEEQLSTSVHENKKQTAVKDQKIEFLEVQINELREQLEDANTQHQNMVQALQNQQDARSEGSDPADKFELLHKEMTQVNQEQLNQIKELTQHLDQQHQKVSDLELKIKLNQAEYERQLTQYKQLLDEQVQKRTAEIEKVRSEESAKTKQLEQAQIKYKEAIASFEKQLEEKDAQVLTEVREVQSRSEEQLAQLKNFYELEKEKIELRVTEEKERSNRRMANLQEELEQRVREENREKDWEIDCLQNELRELDQRHKSFTNQMENEVRLKQQMVEALERQGKDQKERINYLETNRNSAFERQLEHFEQQRQEYSQKTDKLMHDNLEKDKQLAKNQHKLERQTEELQRLQVEMKHLKDQVDKEKKVMQEKLDTTKRKLSEQQDESMHQKLEYGREQALSKQQIEFLNKKIEELQRNLEDGQRFFDEKIKVCRQEILDDAQAQVNRISSEKELWEQKYEQKRQSMRDLEQSLTRQNAELEKRATVQQSQITRLERELQETEDTHREEILNLQIQIQNLDQSSGQATQYSFEQVEDMMQLKAQMQEMEREMADLQSTYDRDKALWEGKCMFLEGQKENYKKDLVESQKKFEITLEQLQKRGTYDKDKQEVNQQAILKILEKKYKSQIKEMIEAHQALNQESQAKIKRQDQELQKANEQLALHSKSKHSDYQALEKKVGSLMDNERRLTQEMNDIIAEKDRKFAELQSQQEKDREIYKQKLFEADRKIKEADNKRALQIFELEKERAKWQMEIDHIKTQKSEVEEYAKALERQNETSRRENDKLRNDAKGATRSKYAFQNATNYGTRPAPGGTPGQQMADNISRFMIGKTLQNQLNNSQSSSSTNSLAYKSNSNINAAASIYGTRKENTKDEQQSNSSVNQFAQLVTPVRTSGTNFSVNKSSSRYSYSNNQ